MFPQFSYSSVPPCFLIFISSQNFGTNEKRIFFFFLDILAATLRFEMPFFLNKKKACCSEFADGHCVGSLRCQALD